MKKTLGEKEAKIDELIQKRALFVEELNALKLEKNEAMKVAGNIKNKMVRKMNAIKDVSAKIGTLKGEYSGKQISAKVSDHAIVRYLERYKGIDMFETVNEILEHPDRRYRGDMVTTIYAETEPDQDLKDISKTIRLAKKSQYGKSKDTTKANQ